MIRQITDKEREMLADRHPYDTMCDCPACKGTRRREEAMAYMEELDAEDDSDEYYRFNPHTLTFDQV